GRQLEIRMNLESGPTGTTGATLQPEVMQDLVLTAFDFRPVERCQLGSNGGAELGNLLALGIVGSCFQFETRNERGYRVDVVSDHVGATAHGFHQAGSPSDEGIQGHRAVQRHLTQEGVPKAVRFISIKRKTGQDWPELRTEASGEPAVNPIERVRALTFPHGKFSDFGRSEEH